MRYAALWRRNAVENVASRHRVRATIALRRRPDALARGRRRQASSPDHLGLHREKFVGGGLHEGEPVLRERLGTTDNGRSSPSGVIRLPNCLGPALAAPDP